MKRITIVVMIVMGLMNVAPIQAQDDGCRSLMGQVNTLIGQAMTALENDDVEAAQSLLSAAHTLAGLCLDAPEETTVTADDAWVEFSFDVVHGGVMTLAHPPGWEAFTPPGEPEDVAGVFLFSSAAARDAAMNSEDGGVPPGEMVVRVTVMPLEAVEGDYNDIVDAARMLTEDWEGVQAGAITETTFNDLSAAYVTVYEPAQNAQNFVVLIEGESVFILLMGRVAEGDAALVEQIVLAIAESIVVS